MGDRIIDIMFKVISILSWGAAILILFKNRIKKNVAEKKAIEEDKKINQNKENQKEKEKEIDNMAKFLCDKCGKETDVSAAKHYESERLSADLCPECFTKLEHRDEQIAKAQADLKEAEERVAQCKSVLLELSKDMEEKDAQETDILKKLGL